MCLAPEFQIPIRLCDFRLNTTSSPGLEIKAANRIALLPISMRIKKIHFLNIYKYCWYVAHISVNYLQIYQKLFPSRSFETLLPLNPCSPSQALQAILPLPFLI